MNDLKPLHILQTDDELSFPGLMSCWARFKAHLCRRRLPNLTRSAPHAGAGGARSRAMSISMSLNICRDTATSAIWNVT